MEVKRGEKLKLGDTVRKVIRKSNREVDGLREQLQEAKKEQSVPQQSEVQDDKKEQQESEKDGQEEEPESEDEKVNDSEQEVSAEDQSDQESLELGEVHRYPDNEVPPR